MNGGITSSPLRGPSGLWALFLGTPLALWLGVGSPSTPAAAAEPAASVSARQDAPPPDVSSAPPEPCVRQLLTPFAAMAGFAVPLPAEVSDPPQVDVARRTTGGLAARVFARPDAQRTWLARVEETAQRLATAFGEETPAHITPLIATIPDVVDSGLGYQYELSLQSIRRALEQPVNGKSYFRDRSWLPWDDRELPPEGRQESERCRLTTPGIMLFRGSDSERPAIVALLLVGESPTSGLRQAAMSNALSVASTLNQANPGKTVRRLRIVGPSFSGSALSLRLSLRNWASREKWPSEFEVKSGTATGSEVPRLLGGKAERFAAGATISFESTTAREASTECAYLNFLKYRLGVDAVPASAARASGQRAPLKLEGVATLSESGTEFGATWAGKPGFAKGASSSTFQACKLAASSEFVFPFHVSSLRDAYEALDHRDEQSRSEDASIARVTSLDASLREARAPLDVELHPSQKTRTAQDITLRNLLEQISRRAIRHVAIHATDVGDAIFLARKIRDIAPDVRLAFFQADALLLHADYRRDLKGSLVVSPYPFLGVHEFATGPSSDRLVGFESGSAQGLYNAVLAQRSAPPSLLSNYGFDEKHPLPTWISTIGRGSLVPLKVSPTRDCEGSIYGTREPNPAKEICSAEPASGAWKRFDSLRVANLELDPKRSLPHLWNLLFVTLVFAFGFDVANQNKAARRFATDRVPSHLFSDGDQPLDRAMGRTKWRLYASIRSFLFALVFAYVAAMYLLSFLASGPSPAPDAALLSMAFDGALVAASALCFIFAVRRTESCARRFAVDYADFGRCVGAHLLPWTWDDFKDTLRVSAPPAPDAATQESLALADAETRAGTQPERAQGANSRSFLDRFSLGLGIAKPVGRLDVARTSFAQLRLILVTTLFLAVVFGALFSTDIWVAADVGFSDLGNVAVPALSMTVLRNTPLTNGVAPFAPALLCVACVYVWSIGRMARLALAHGTSRVSPPDGVADLVSTPIRLVLYPSYAKRGTSDEGFTEIERAVLNAIWRPIAGRYYVLASSVLALVPIVLFIFIKPLSTLEGTAGTWLLGSGLALTTFLIGVTFVQLVQYWIALERLLKRTMEHPLGTAFGSVPPFARDSVDHQMSRSPSDVLRWTACARQFGDLVASLGFVRDAVPFIAERREKLVGRAVELRTGRTAALTYNGQECGGSEGNNSEPPGVQRTAEPQAPGLTGAQPGLDAEIALSEHVVLVASEVTELLEHAWDPAFVAEQTVQKRKVAPVLAQFERTLPLAMPGIAAGDRTETATRLGPPLQVADSWPAPASLGFQADSSNPPSAQRRSAPKEQLVQLQAAEWVVDATADALTPVAYRFSQADLRWLRSAQTFVASVVTLLIHRHVRQFRYFVHTLTACALLLLLALTSYPFEPYRLLVTFIWIVMGSVALASLWIFIRMDRNPLMSYVAGTSPNRLTLDGAFIFRVFAWVVVPLLSAAAAQYPELARVLVSIVGPIAKALH